MKFSELALKRKSCRKYTAQKVEKEVIIDLIKTMQTSPSACNSQPYKCVVTQDEMAFSIHKAIMNPLLPINRFTKDVSTFVVVCETPAKLMRGLNDQQKYAQMDLGIAVSTFCYAAADVGLATCIIGSFNEEKVKELLNIPEEIKVRLIISLGYADNEERVVKNRKQLEDVVSFNCW